MGLIIIIYWPTAMQYVILLMMIAGMTNIPSKIFINTPSQPTINPVVFPYTQLNRIFSMVKYTGPKYSIRFDSFLQRLHFELFIREITESTASKLRFVWNIFRWLRWNIYISSECNLCWRQYQADVISYITENLFE